MSFSPFRHLGSVLWKQQPIQLTFFLTRRCNARCPFCFYLSTEQTGKQPVAELALDEIQKISASLGKLLWLAFSGGEIFLRRDLVEIVSTFYVQNKPAIILLPTNGLLTETIGTRVEEVLRRCPQSTVAVKLSLEGLQPVHDAIRGENGFRRTMATYEILGELVDRYENFELGINTVFCASNQDNMAETIEFVAGLDRVRTHTVSLIRGEVSDSSLKAIDLEKYRAACGLLQSNIRKNLASRYRFRGARLKAAQDILQRRLIYETVRQNRRLIPCYAGRLNLVLSEAGDLYPCESFAEKIGNVRASGYDIKQLLATPQARRIMRSISNNGCHCTHECYFMTNILFNPRQYPALFKEYLQIS